MAAASAVSSGGVGPNLGAAAGGFGAADSGAGGSAVSIAGAGATSALSLDPSNLPRGNGSSSAVGAGRR